MKLLIESKGIPISFGNETNVETVFGLNDNETDIIQGVTFECNIFPNKNCLNESIHKKTKRKEIDHGFLFYSFRYQISFTHYLTQTIPKLYDYFNYYLSYKLLVPSHHHSLFQQEYLNLCGIKEENIEILDDDTIYNIKHYAISTKYRALPDPFTSSHLFSYELVRKGLNIPVNLNSKRRVYLKRDGQTNTEYGNSETGILRVIQNETELIEYLEQNGFEIITLGSKSIKEKSNLLNNIDILIAPWGANCMNIIFSNSPRLFFLFGNNRMFGLDYFYKLSQSLNNSIIDFRFKCYECNDEILDPLNHSNASYKVDINDFKALF